jgi:hypothetical protein
MALGGNAWGIVFIYVYLFTGAKEKQAHCIEKSLFQVEIAIIFSFAISQA